MRVFFGTPTHGSPRLEYMTGIYLMWEHEVQKGADSLLVGRHFAMGPYISRNRNDLVVKMYEADADALMMVDHDVYCRPDTMERMAAILEETGAGAVSGDLILGNDCPSTGFINDPNDHSRFIVAKQASPEQAVGRVDTVATSCIMVRRRVFNKISTCQNVPEKLQTAPWFGPGTWFMHWPLWSEPDERWKELGEDFAFSRRAGVVGEPLVVAYDLGLEHWKVGKMLARPNLKEEK